uniref:clp protease proteolytic subunit n=1 Tax=Diervilla lonicera TaxID=79606 RepID=UPI002E7A7D79|nr:clp protease proteolytic subunit [Diervilla lonicera]WRH31175.1 clp protease proteolytic subunit [Diervilla lonicera]
MPIGVPKVVFHIPGDEEPSWVDIYRLYQERILFLGQELDAEIANQIMGLMICLTIQNPTRDLALYINTPGGSIIYGFAIYDMIQLINPDVYTLALGLAASMGSFILAGGTITKRVAFPHRVMIHQPVSSFFQTYTGEYMLEAAIITQMRENITEVYAQRTGQPFSVLWEDMERDTFMSATEARAYGIVDLIGL